MCLGCTVLSKVLAQLGHTLHIDSWFFGIVRCVSRKLHTSAGLRRASAVIHQKAVQKTREGHVKVWVVTEEVRINSGKCEGYAVVRRTWPT